jgi:cell division septation protein DedD
MLRTNESETEILLGNKQLLGIFFVVAILLGVAFYGGYVVGKGAAARKPASTASAPPADQPATASTPVTGGETHSVPAESAPGAETAPAASDTATQSSEPPLGSPKRKNVENPVTASSETAAPEAFTPRAGQTFLQVTATGRDEAVAIADVLQKKGFRAHAVPRPGSSKLYRVLVGPIHDPADLSSTRDSLRRTGFREVIVQHY